MDASGVPKGGDPYTEPARCCEGCRTRLGQRLGKMLLPHPSKRFSQFDVGRARDVFDVSKIDPDRRDKEAVLNGFDVETVLVQFTMMGRHFRTHARVITSKGSPTSYHNHGRLSGAVRTLDLANGQLFSYMRAFVDAKTHDIGLRILHVSQYGIESSPDGINWAPWTAARYATQGAVCRAAFQTLEVTYGKLDSLALSSMGTVYLAGAKATDIPPTLFISRGKPSVAKAAKSVGPVCIVKPLVCLAKWAGWAGSPEDELVRLAPSIGDRTVVFLNVTRDVYFFHGRDFARRVTDSLRSSGARVNEFYLDRAAADSHPRAHHGNTEDHFWSEEAIVGGGGLTLGAHERFTDFIVRAVFLRNSTGRAKSD